MIDVSVIIPMYNMGDRIEECLASICKQTLKNIEILCVNDGSTDDTLSVLNRIAETDPRITIINQENKGAGAARNRGLREAKGRYLSILDADDFFEPDMLERSVAVADRERSEIVVYRTDFFHSKTKAFTPCTYGLREDLLPKSRPFSAFDVERDIFKVVVGWAWDKLFRAAYVYENDLWFQEQRTSNDLLFVFSALAKAQRISTISDVLVHHRIDEEGTLSVTRERSWMCFYDALQALRKQLQAWGLFDRYEQDYINYALHFSLWNLNTLKEPTRRLLYRKLKKEWFTELGIVDCPADRFYHMGEYRQFRKIMDRPYILYDNKAVAQMRHVKQWLRTKLKRIIESRRKQ